MPSMFTSYMKNNIFEHKFDRYTEILFQNKFKLFYCRLVRRPAR